jgi:hypothetical protein
MRMVFTREEIIVSQGVCCAYGINFSHGNYKREEMHEKILVGAAFHSQPGKPASPSASSEGRL